MARIGDLIPKLKDEAKAEKDMFSGKRQREFFIELMGVDDLDGLVGMFNADDHNSDWDAERQKTNPDIETVMLNRRAIAFMSSGKMGVIRHYWETELKSHAMGRARMIWAHNMLDQADSFTKMRQE